MLRRLSALGHGRQHAFPEARQSEPLWSQYVALCHWVNLLVVQKKQEQINDNLAGSHLIFNPYNGLRITLLRNTYVLLV